MPIRITGLNSGLDTEAIISALVSSYNYKTNKYKKAQTKLSWKQEKWKTLNTKIYSLYNSIGNLRFSSAYNLKKTTVSDTTKATVKAGSGAPNGTQKLNILEIAQAGYLTGGKLDGNVTKNTTLAELGYTGGDGKINVTKGDGTTTTIEVSQGTKVSDFLTSLQKAGLTANYDDTNKRIYVSSKETGKNNDFTLTGANADGVSALFKMGLSVDSDATKATYTSYAKYVTNAPAGTSVEDYVKDMITAYQNAQKDFTQKTNQNANLSAAYGYASAYEAMMDALAKTGLNAGDQEKLRTLLGMTATQRVNSVMDANGNVYTAKGTDKDGNAIFSYNDNGTEKYIQRVITYKDENGANYKLNADKKSYTDDAGTTWNATSKKDSAGNVIYSDGNGNERTITSTTSYYEATASEQNTGETKYTDVNGNVYETKNGIVTTSDGTQYKYDAASKTLQEVDASGNVVASGKTISIDDTKTAPVTETVYTQGAARTDIKRSADELSDLRTAAGTNLTDDDVKNLTSNISTVNTYEKTADKLDDADPYSKKNITAAIQAAYAAGDVSAVTNTYAQIINNNKADITAAEKVIADNKVLDGLSKMDLTTQAGQDALDAFVQQAQDMKATVDSLSTQVNTGAKKIDGSDSKIKLNGIEYTSSENNYSINGLSIAATGVTGDGDANAITITTATDTQGLYDTIKDFLTQYNALINEITSLYNAESAKGYEPLTSEEKDAMSDSEVELWEEKVKSALLRRDTTLGGVMSSMTLAMSKGVKIGDKTYYLSSFGIRTLGYLNAPENQHNAYHIDGDEDDISTKTNADKLMAAITSDPDTVISFMQQLATNLYDAVGDKMSSTSLSSAFTVYNDKEMASEYSDYTSLIKKWEDKLEAQEEYYYKKFSQMETALSKLNSQSSALAGLFGN
ncbi:MAG: flagellar filament capping protein FliD [Roseburia sp.]|jgi:flagellar hook-associated protein 2|nr:flagellar filament capping protein FliD [Roseburia sp.]